jgi:hypothetical protein
MEILLHNIINSRGIIYIYSELVEDGVLTIAMMLEYNGYQLNTDNKRVKTALTTFKIDPQEHRCALCGERRMNHRDNVHDFIQGRYLLFTGKHRLTDTDMTSFNQSNNLNGKIDNRYGAWCKMIIGSRASSTGIDYHNIRQVHIFDPWHNNTRMYQVIGRAARYCSHKTLPKEERNVTVFRYCASAPELYYQYLDQFDKLMGSGQLKNKVPDHEFTFAQLFSETNDEKIYRRIERKDRFIKQIERILKTLAVDCGLNKSLNVPPTEDERRAKRGTRECDFTDCDYTCEGGVDAIMDPHINSDTYNMYFYEPQISQVEQIISQEFQENFVMTLDHMVRHIIERHPQVEANIVYEALDRILGHPPQRKPIVLYDRFRRPGHLIFADPYYVFQPDDLEDPKAPLYYKTTPLTVKKHAIDLKPVEKLHMKTVVTSSIPQKQMEIPRVTIRTPPVPVPPAPAPAPAPHVVSPFHMPPRPSIPIPPIPAPAPAHAGVQVPLMAASPAPVSAYQDFDLNFVLTELSKKDLDKYLLNYELNRMPQQVQAQLFESLYAEDYTGYSLQVRDWMIKNGHVIKPWLIEYFTKTNKLLIYNKNVLGHVIGEIIRFYGPEKLWQNWLDVRRDPKYASYDLIMNEQIRTLEQNKATANPPCSCESDTKSSANICGTVTGCSVEDPSKRGRDRYLFKIKDCGTQQVKPRTTAKHGESAVKASTLARGRVCLNYHVDALIAQADRVGVDKRITSGSSDKKALCREIELQCNRNDDLRKDGRHWFYHRGERGPCDMVEKKEGGKKPGRKSKPKT